LILEKRAGQFEKEVTPPPGRQLFGSSEKVIGESVESAMLIGARNKEAELARNLLERML
jgi:hypothetical protein